MPGKVKMHELSEAEREHILKDFFVVVASLNNVKEVERLLKDLLSPSEMVMIARRIQIAKRLLAGQLQEDIRREMRVGFTTINQVERWLNGGFDGYKSALKKVKKGEFSKLEVSNEMVFSFDWLRKKYPAHFLLFNLLAKDNKK